MLLIDMEGTAYTESRSAPYNCRLRDFISEIHVMHRYVLQSFPSHRDSTAGKVDAAMVVIDHHHLYAVYCRNSSYFAEVKILVRRVAVQTTSTLLGLRTYRFEYHRSSPEVSVQWLPMNEETHRA